MKTDLKPLMRKSEIKVLERELLLLGKQKERINILEWGSGGSTIYFSNFLEEKRIQYTWLSLEYNKQWYQKVFERIKNNSNIKMILFDVGNNNLRQRNDEMNEYVEYPKSLEKKFDFILVDGRKRRRCLLEAQKLLNPGGVVFLHDAQRKYYHCVLGNYSDSFFICPHLWRGKNEQVNFFRKVFYKFFYLFWQPIIYLDFWGITILRKIYNKFKIF
jgi:hypothetical protein